MSLIKRFRDFYQQYKDYMQVDLIMYLIMIVGFILLVVFFG